MKKIITCLLATLGLTTACDKRMTTKQITAASVNEQI